MKTITNKDGKMETVPSSDVDAQELLKKTRRELRDMLAGNTQFHEDEFKTPEKPKEEERSDYQQSIFDFIHGNGII